MCNDQQDTVKQPVIQFSDDLVEKTKKALQAIKEPPIEKDLRWAIGKLKPEINAKLKAGLTYKQIASIIYQNLGLADSNYKLDKFWRVLVKFHNPREKNGKNVKSATEQRPRRRHIPADTMVDTMPDSQNKKPSRAEKRAARRLVREAENQNTPALRSTDQPNDSSVAELTTLTIEVPDPKPYPSNDDMDIRRLDTNDLGSPSEEAGAER